MDGLQKGILALIKAGITGESCPLPEDFSLEEAVKPLHRHQLSSLGYQGAVTCGLNRETPTMTVLLHQYFTVLLRSERQQAAIEALFAQLDALQIDYLPLKGTNMKALYPKPELRSMSDADVLIRLEQYPKIQPLADKLGYQQVGESNHEIIWHKPELHLELHKMLIPSYNPDYYAYFGDGWNLARKGEGTRYHMDPEDAYVYQFTHFAKHYRDGGIGVRHVVDLWVFRRSYPELSESRLRSALEKLQLLEFYENISRLTDAWFAGGELDEKLQFMTDYLFDSGSFGKWENHVLAQNVRNRATAGSARGGRILTVTRLLFPNLEAMAGQFSVLKKLPWLLPVFWPVRWVRAVLFRRNNIRTQKRNLQASTADKVDAFEEGLKYVGLEFRFQE